VDGVRVFRQFVWLEAGSVKAALSRPTHQQVTLTVVRRAVETNLVLMPEGGITMIKMEQSIIINRPVEEVWKFMSNIENATKWDRGVLEAKQTSEGPIGVGSTLQTRRQMLGRQRIGKYQVLEFVPNRILVLQGSLGRSTAQIRYTFEPLEGGTRLTGTLEAELRGWLKLMTPIFIPMMERDGREDMANVKRIMEAPA
jgi:carbon monoxide dehydrogenase subunit G